MNAQGSSSSPKPPKVKREHNKFLYDVVNQFSYDEFKKYTNFKELMQQVLNENCSPTQQNRLEHYVKQNFRKNVPNEENWKRNGFRNLNLTKDFYGSATADRIFENLYGIKICKIDLEPIRLDGNDSKNQHDVMEVNSDVETPHIEKIDLTGDELHDTPVNGPPRRRIKYPRKQIDPNVAGPSGIATYHAIRNSSAQKQMPVPIVSDGFSDEIRVSSTESVIESLNSSEGNQAANLVERANEPSATIPKTKPHIIVISDITLMSPLRTTVQDQVVLEYPEKPVVGSVATIACKICPKIASESASQLIQVPIEEQHSLPKKHCQNLPQINTSIPLGNIKCPVDKSPSKNPESANCINDLRRSLETQLQNIREQFEQYAEKNESSTLSLKRFWSEFYKPENDSDSSAVETQLNNSKDVGQDGQNQSPVIFSANLVDEQTYLNAQIKMEKMHDERNESNSSDVEIIEVPIEHIEIGLDSTQELIDNLQVDHNTEEHLIEPFAIPQQPIGTCKKVKSTASSSKGFLTSLPKLSNKKRTYQPLNVVVDAASTVPPIALPNYDFSQQPDTPEENYEIEECTMTDSELQRYELLNNENTIFLSSQLENSEFNAGKQINPRAVTIPNENQQVIGQKRSSPDVLDIVPIKRRRCAENIKREVHWKIISLKTLTFKPLSQNIFHLEFQLRNNFDTFYIKDQQSIKRMLHLSDKEWQHVIKIVTALCGYRYDVANLPIMPQKLDLLSRIMNCFVRSIPLFVRSSIQFNDFMGHCLEVTEQQPLKNECVDSAIDSNTLKKMIEFKKKLGNKFD